MRVPRTPRRRPPQFRDAPQNPTPEQLKAHDWPGRSETLKACKLDNPHHVYLPWDIEEAYMIDSGDMYFEVLKEYEGHRGAIGNGHS